MVLAVAVAAGLFIHRCTNYPSGQPDASAPAGASSVPSDSAVSAPVILDTVYVEIAEKEKVPIVREHKADAGQGEAETPAASETVILIPVQELSGLIPEKAGRSISLATQSPDHISVSYSGEVDLPVLGKQKMDFTTRFRIVEAKGDRLVLQLDSGAGTNAAADLIAPLVLERLPEGLVESFSSGRAVVNLSAVPQIRKHLSGISLTGISVDESNIRLSAVKK